MSITSIGSINIDETAVPLKISIPLRRNWALFGLFFICLIVWVAVLGRVVAAMFTGGYGWLLNFMLLLWLAGWYFLGKKLWRFWQFNAAARELFFIDEKILVIRRPVSLLGLTDAYDWQHIKPFFYDESRGWPGFEYGSRHIFFGHTLPENEAKEFVDWLNGRYFPYLDDDFEE